MSFDRSGSNDLRSHLRCSARQLWRRYTWRMARPLKDTCSAAADIMDGKLDRHLHHLEQAIKERRLARAEELGITPGARVRFERSCPEPHLRGKTHTVTEVFGRTFHTSEGMSVMVSWVERDWVEVMPSSRRRY